MKPNTTPFYQVISQSMMLLTITILAIFMMPRHLHGEVTASQSATQVRLARQVTNAEKLQHRYQMRVQQADSLMAVGDSLVTITAEAINEVTNRMKQRAEEYSSQRRYLERKLADATREEFTQLRLDIRNLDAQYRAQLTADEVIMRAAIREGEIGAANQDRGRENKREAQRLLRDVEKQLADLHKEIGSHDIAQEN